MISALPFLLPMPTASPGSPLRPDGVLPLPVRAEAAARAVSFDNELRLLITLPGAGATAQIRISDRRRLERLPELPVVASGAIGCGDQLLVTGADRQGRPWILGLDDTGKPMWQTEINGPTPTRWPVPACLGGPAVAWQATSHKLEIADVGPAGLTRHRSLEIGGPPTSMAAGDGSLWCAWGDGSGVRVAEINEHRERVFQLASAFPDELAIGTGPAGAAIAWSAKGRTWLAPAEPDADTAQAAATPVPLHLGAAAGGVLTVVVGSQPLVWAQRLDSVEDEEPSLTSALCLAGADPFLLDGLIHHVAWWNDTVVVVGDDELILLSMP